MRFVRAINKTRDVVIAARIAVADSFGSRGWGLLGHAGLQRDEGMLITKTNCIHTMFMRFPFDALYVDRHGAACRLVVGIRPFRFGPFVAQADYVLELAQGTLARTGTALGDNIVCEPI